MKEFRPSSCNLHDAYGGGAFGIGRRPHARTGANVNDAIIAIADFRKAVHWTERWRIEASGLNGEIDAAAIAGAIADPNRLALHRAAIGLGVCGEVGQV